MVKTVSVEMVSATIYDIISDIQRKRIYLLELNDGEM